MPSIADSLRAAGYLEPGLEGFGRFFQRKQQEEDQQSFNQMMADAVNQMKNNFAPESMPQRTALSDLMPKPAIAAPMGALSAGNRNPLQPQSLNDLKNTGLPSSYAQMTPLQQKQHNLQIMSEMLMKSNALKNLPPDKLQQGMQALQLMAEGTQQPQPNFKFVSAPETSSVYRYDVNNPGAAPQVIQQGKLKTPNKTETVLGGDGTPKITEKGGHKFITVRHTYDDGSSTEELKPLPGKININTGGSEAYKGYSKDYAKVVTGIDEIKNLKNQIYNPNNLHDMVDSQGNTKKVVSVSTTGGVKQMTPNEAAAYKEQVKAQYTGTALSTLKKLKLDPALQKIREGINKYKIPSDQAVDTFIKNNPQLSEDEQDAIRNYFELESQ